jgi:hypothetical protein
MKVAVLFWLVSLVAFAGVVAKNGPVPDHMFAAMDQRRARPLNVNGQRMVVTTSDGPLLLLFRRPFDGLFAKALFLSNLCATVGTLSSVFWLERGATRSRTISDIAGAIFLTLSGCQWLLIGVVARRWTRRANQRRQRTWPAALLPSHVGYHCASRATPLKRRSVLWHEIYDHALSCPRADLGDKFMTTRRHFHEAEP